MKDPHVCGLLISCIYGHSQSQSITNTETQLFLSLLATMFLRNREGSTGDNWQGNTTYYSHVALQQGSQACLLLQHLAAVPFSVPLFFTYLQNWERWSLFLPTPVLAWCLCPLIQTLLRHAHRGLWLSLVI